MRAGNRPRRRARFRRAIAFRAICQKSKCLDRIIVLQITRFVSLELMIGILTSSVLSLLLMQDPATLFQRAYQMQQAGDYTHAAEAYIEFLKLRPDEVAGISNLGVVLVKLGRYDEAIAEYEAAEKLLPNDPRIELNLALAYSKSGRLTEAAAKLEALPKDNQVTLLLADTRLRMGENQRVIDLLKPLRMPAI